MCCCMLVPYIGRFVSRICLIFDYHNHLCRQPFSYMIQCSSIYPVLEVNLLPRLVENNLFESIPILLVQYCFPSIPEPSGRPSPIWMLTSSSTGGWDTCHLKTTIKSFKVGNAEAPYKANDKYSPAFAILSAYHLDFLKILTVIVLHP